MPTDPGNPDAAYFLSHLGEEMRFHLAIFEQRSSLSDWLKRLRFTN